MVRTQSRLGSKSGSAIALIVVGLDPTADPSASMAVACALYLRNVIIAASRRGGGKGDL